MRAICTVGVSEVRDFSAYHARFERTICQSGFHAADMVLRWRDTWPPGSPSYREVNYAFKVHAIAEARRRGADRVLYLDVPCHAIRSMEPIWQQVERDGHFFLVGGDRLGNFSSDLCLGIYGMSRDEAMDIQLFSGTIIGLDFRRSRTVDFFERLCDVASALHFNGSHVSGVRGAPGGAGRASDDPRCWEHRSDEPHMTLIARDLGMEPTWRGGYFIGDMEEHETAILKSGYTIDPRAPIEPVFEVVAEHTVEAARLGAGGWVLDAGCRNFGFAREMARRGCKVVAMDPDLTVEDPKIEGVEFVRQALDVNEGERGFRMTEDPQARHLARHGSEGDVQVHAVSIETVMEERGIKVWDCVKLDVEGAEIGVLRAWPGPIAKQISVEFHEHCFPVAPETFREILDHLGQWYDVARHERDARHGAGMNFWDSLFLLRGAK